MSPESVPAPADLQGFVHVRVLIGLVTGLSVTRIVTGLARIVQEGGAHPAQCAWAGFVLLYVLHFWWTQFGLSALPRWRFEAFAFVLAYAAAIFFAAALLFPDRPDGTASFRATPHWFYGVLIVILVLDAADTALRGRVHYVALGWPYAARQAALLTLAALGLTSRGERRHTRIGLAGIAVEILWIAARDRDLT